MRRARHCRAPTASAPVAHAGRCAPCLAVRWSDFAGSLPPNSVMLPLLSCSRPEMMANSVVLPAPLGPIRPTNSPRLSCMSTSANACRPPKRMPMPLRSSSVSSRSVGIVRDRQRRAVAAAGGLHRQEFLDRRRQALRPFQQHHHQNDIDTMTSRLPEAPQRASTSCSAHCALSRVSAPTTPPTALVGPPTTAMIRSLNEVISAKGDGLTKRSSTHVETAGECGEHRREHEHLDAQHGGVDAETARHAGRVELQRRNGAADARISQARRTEHGEQHRDPDQLSVKPIVGQRIAEQRKRRNLVEAGRSAGNVMPGGEGACERNPVGECRQRQIMPAQAQRDVADQGGNQRRHRDAEDQCEHAVDAIGARHQRRTIGAEAHEGGLS